jgi:hypothetical protein
MLRLSTLSTALPIAYASADPDLTPQRTRRYELAVARHVGQMWIEARTFDEETADRLVNVFSGPRNARLLQITNGGDLSVRGVGVQVSQSIGRSVQGTVTYTFGASRSTGPETFATPFLADAGTAAFRDGSFHDLAARVESVFDWTDTRLVALYRISMLRPSAGVGSGAVRTSRFDFQLSQGLPFIGALTRAEWDLLFAVRNSFYETADGGTLDEMAVVNPPKRVMGGIAVRF